MATINEEKYVSIYFDNVVDNESEDELNQKLQDMGINAKLEFKDHYDGTTIKIEKYPK